MRSFVHPYSILLVVIFFGIIFRVYNINYDDLWIDEIITFWIANPDYTIIESFENHRVPPGGWRVSSSNRYIFRVYRCHLEERKNALKKKLLT